MKTSFSLLSPPETLRRLTGWFVDTNLRWLCWISCAILMSIVSTELKHLRRQRRKAGTLPNVITFSWFPCLKLRIVPAVSESSHGGTLTEVTLEFRVRWT